MGRSFARIEPLEREPQAELNLSRVSRGRAAG
jgi:hypothetical protein